MVTDDLIRKVLETWPGTPEELGSSLHDATMDIEPSCSHEERMLRREQRHNAGIRLRHCNGGQELISAELVDLKEYMQQCRQDREKRLIRKMKLKS